MERTHEGIVRALSMRRKGTEIVDFCDLGFGSLIRTSVLRHEDPILTVRKLWLELTMICCSLDWILLYSRAGPDIATPS
jgi:hypothetical protein